MTNGNPTNVYGHYSTSTNGHEFEVYYLIIPAASVWIYSVKERNWTRVSNITPSVTPTVVGAFYTGASIRIMDLKGPISSQNWTFSTLGSQATPLDSTAFGGASGGYLGLFDFTGTVMPGTLMTGSLSFGDTRHSKNLRKVRIVCEALQDFDITISAQNEQGQKESEYYVVKSDPGTTTYQVFPFHIPGVFITLTFQFNTNVVGNFNLSEIGLQYDTGAEVRTQ